MRLLIYVYIRNGIWFAAFIAITTAIIDEHGFEEYVEDLSTWRENVYLAERSCLQVEFKNLHTRPALSRTI